MYKHYSRCQISKIRAGKHNFRLREGKHMNTISTIVDIVRMYPMRKTCHCNKNGGAQLKDVAAFLSIIAEPHRLHILCFLKESEHCVCDIWQHLDLPQNLVSHHLKGLKDFGLIVSRKEGLKVIYRINARTMNKYEKLLSHFLPLL